MEFTAKQIADMIGGRVEGNEHAAISSFAKIEEGKPGAISFLSNPKYTHYLMIPSRALCSSMRMLNWRSPWQLR